ncbi:hypothetical protein ScPMuIL_002918 [Solemya velum]
MLTPGLGTALGGDDLRANAAVPPDFLYDDGEHAMIVKIGSTCFFAHLNHDERDLLTNSISLAALEKSIIAQISTYNVRSWFNHKELKKYNHAIETACRHLRLAEIHLDHSHISVSNLVTHSTNITNTTETEILFDRAQATMAVLTVDTCYVGRIGNVERNMLDTPSQLHALEATLLNELKRKTQFVPLTASDINGYGAVISTACSNMPIYRFHLAP